MRGARTLMHLCRPLPGLNLGGAHSPFFKYKSDKPLYVIDASNVDQYADKLNPGQVALIKQTNLGVLRHLRATPRCRFPVPCLLSDLR